MKIYKTTNKINNKFYIGKDKYNNPKYIGSGIKLKNAIKKYGKCNFEKEILEYCDSSQELNEREIYWIKKLDAIKCGYNMTDGGDGGNTLIKKNEKEIEELKIKHSISAKKYWNNLSDNEKEILIKNRGIKKGTKNPKMSEQRKGRGNPMFGNYMYKIWIEKYGLEKANNKMIDWKNKMNTEERRFKISLKSKNRKHSDETKFKISKSKKGKTSNVKGRLWMNNGFKNIMILSNELNDYMDNGWLTGRFKKNNIV
jgi:group I intron endonuclease